MPFPPVYTDQIFFQDDFQLVRKLGRGKYSEVRTNFLKTYQINLNFQWNPWAMHHPFFSCVGVRVHQHKQQWKVCGENTEASQEKENQARDKNSGKPERRN